MSAGELTPGVRFPDGEWELEPGGYSKHRITDGDVERDAWWICTPSGERGMLTLHDVVENEDGTITVDERPPPADDPGNRNSILTFARDGSRGWHGYIDGGVWREI